MDLDALLQPHRAALDHRLQAPLARLELAGGERLHAMTLDQLRSGGKQLRGLLPAALVQAGGGPVAAAIELGACIELIHNGTLVHDDIQDGDRFRRGQPTLWTIHGQAQAINVGDAMLVGPIAAILRAEVIPSSLRGPLASLLTEALLETIRGQVADLSLRDLPDPRREDLAAVHVAKTGPLFAACLAGAALLLDRPQASIDAAHDLAQGLGLAFQVRDDLLDALGAKGRGAPGADLREGKPTWPMLRALEHATPEQAIRLRGQLRRAAEAPLTDAEVAATIAWLHQSGGIEQTRGDLANLLQDARSAAGQVFAQDSAEIVVALCDRLARLDG
jgi:geranylgeranyl diphosphate synthase type I